jgi:threonine/homoserine efflux transporter RhtA
MAELSRASYSLMVSLLPAIATVVGVVVLTQLPSVAEIAGVALVIAGVAVHRDLDEDAAALHSASREEYGRARPANTEGEG